MKHRSPWSNVAILGVVASSILIYYEICKRLRRYNPKRSIKSPSKRAQVAEIRDELFSRNISFFNAERFAKIEKSFIVVVGLGGVGSHAANMLVRSGVRHIRLIDFDQVTLSSLNRNAMATMDDVGKSKALVMRARLLTVVPWCEIEVVVEMFKGEYAERLLAGHPDYVLDCIDDVSTKADLISFCHKHRIPVLTSMGWWNLYLPTSSLFIHRGGWQG
jgi:tRNA A37 threonylcarbamoyladenosine dehydratase